MVTNNSKARPAAQPQAPKTAAAPDKGMPVGPLMTVVTRNQFYRDGFRNMIGVAIAEAVIIVLLILTLLAQIAASQPENRYFATTADGRIMQLVALDRPNMDKSALLSWVAQATSETMTFGFHDYQRRLQQSSRHFTRRGWESFATALQESRIIEAIQAQQQVVSAQPKSAPTVLQEGAFNGKYRWIVELSLQVTYRSGQSNRVDNMQVKMVIERVPSLENPNGIGIEQWIAL